MSNTIGAPRLTRVVAALLVMGGATVAPAQETGKAPKKPKAAADSLKDAGPPKQKKPKAPPMFASEQPLELTLTTNIKQIKKDKTGEAPWRAATISYAGDGGRTVTVPVRVKTRGVWRFKPCCFIF